MHRVISLRALLLNWFLVSFAVTQPARVTIDRSAGPVRLGLNGETGRYYVVESRPNLSDPNSCAAVTYFPPTHDFHSTYTVSSMTFGWRFFRVMSFDVTPPPVIANNFRLIDHQGRSHELYYHAGFNFATNTAVVLIFTGNSCPNVQQLISTIKSLRDQYAPRGVLFWMLDANARDSRSSIVAEANTQGIDLPILHDEAQIVARDCGATSTPEVICLNAADMSVFYRGAIEDRADAGTNGVVQSYLGTALDNFLVGRMVSPSQTLPRGCAVDYKPVPSVSYATHIAPLLRNKCVRCHSDGNIAPWAMTNYSVVQTRARQIKEEVLAARMPPWHPDPFYLAFTNDLSLSSDQKAMLLRWIDDGAPRGTRSDPLASVSTTTNYPFTWPPELGQPDYIVTIPRQSIPATGEVPYRYPSIQVPISTNTWLRAAVIKPGNTRVVHHSLVFVGNLLEVLGGLNGYFAGYVPGYTAIEFPPGTGKKLPANATLTFQMHYTTIGTAQTDQTQLGLYFMKSPPPMELQTRAAFTLDLTIPPGAQEYEREASFVPSDTKDVWLYELSPHMHLRGSRFIFEALYPGGTSEVLLSVPKYVFHWQSLYRFAEPKRLPA